MKITVFTKCQHVTLYSAIHILKLRIMSPLQP